MKIGDEILVRAKIVGLENCSVGSRIRVEIGGLVCFCEIENQEELSERRESQRCGRVKSWVGARLGSEYGSSTS